MLEDIHIIVEIWIKNYNTCIYIYFSFYEKLILLFKSINVDKNALNVVVCKIHWFSRVLHSITF